MSDESGGVAAPAVEDENLELRARLGRMEEARRLVRGSLSDVRALGRFGRAVDPRRWAEECIACLDEALAYRPDARQLREWAAEGEDDAAAPAGPGR